MGIQGMTNWKFSAFLTIALMLVAGLFSSTAMAGDGDGTITLASDTTGFTDARLTAGSTGNTLTFTYTVPTTIDMNNGFFLLEIPQNDGWVVSKKSVTISDPVGTAIYQTNADGAVDETIAAASRGRVEILPSSGDNIRTVKVKLVGWATGGTLTLSFATVTAATPRSLDRLDATDAANERYRRYKFTAKSQKDGGRLTELKAVDADDPADGIQPDEADAARAYARVGNVANGQGTVTITPAVAYQGEKRDFSVLFTATGPMYGSTITIDIPEALHPTATAPDTVGSLLTAALRVHRSSGVTFGTVTGSTVSWGGTVSDAGLVTIAVDVMNVGNTIRVSYPNVTVGTAGVTVAAPDAFVVQTNTVGALANVGGVGAIAPAGPEKDNGTIYLLAGSGTVEITSTTTGTAAVPVDTTHTLAIKYTAAAKFDNVYIRVTLPSEFLGLDTNDDGTADAITALTTDRHDAGTGAENYGYVTGASGDIKVVVDGLSAIWGPIKFAGKGSTFTAGRIHKLKTPAAPIVLDVVAHVNTIADTTANPPSTTSPTDGAVTPQPRIHVLQTSLALGDPDVEFTLSMTGTGVDTADPPAPNPLSTTNLDTFPAGSKYSMEFQFAAIGSSIYNGEVSFEIPMDWTRPVETDATDVAGRVTATLPDGADDDTNRDVVHKDNLIVSGRRITVKVMELARADAAGETNTIRILYGANFAKRPAVQNTAQVGLEITGQYMVGKNARYFPKRATDTATVNITNAADGSGDATIMATGPGSTSPRQVRAGSEGNTITVVFTAAGTMDNGRVSLRLPVATDPDAWGPIQSTASGEKNYINIQSAGLEDAIYSDYVATAYLDELGPGGRVTFTLSNAVAQSGVGLAEFVIQSEGGDSGDGSSTLANVTGIAQTDAEKKANEFGLGKTYSANPGELRIQVVGGDGGSGKVAVSVEETDGGLSEYDVLQDDGTVVRDVVRRIHAGDDAATLKFTYTPTETLQDAELTFTVPPNGWSNPQADSASGAGYTQVTGTGTAQLTFPEYSGGRTVTVPISVIDVDGTIVIDYGLGNGGAKPPTEKGTSTFVFQTTGSGGTTARSIAKQPTVEVYSQASSKGAASVDPMTVTAGAMTAVTITYDPVGQIAGGRARLTVPDAWSGGAEMGAMGGDITVSRGSATYGGGMTEDAIIEHADLTSMHQVLVTGINLGHDDTLTFTVDAQVPLTKGDVNFKLEVDGNDGPDEGNFMEVADSTLTVTVDDAAAGSGMVTLIQGAIVNDELAQGKIVNDTEDNTIELTYTAIGEIGEGKKITVTVPDGWSAPTVTADMQGTFTTKHYLKLADDDADGMPDAGSSLADASTMKAADAADDAMAMIMVATVASEKSLAEGDMVVFTYTGMSPEMPEASQFITEYDGDQVEGDSKVIVQSAEGATALALEADDFNIDGGGSTTVTVKLMASDGSVATSDDDTVVTLTASSGTIASSVTISAGDYHGEATLTASAAANITVTASADGLTGAEIMVHADTDNVMITNVSLSESFAKAGDTVMVTASGTAAQDGMFSVGSVITDEDLTEDEAGSYTGSFTVVADLQDGTHTVTVSLNGASDSSASITIDTIAPTATAASSADEVSNGDMVTISATVVEDGSGVYKVMADVSMLDTTQTDMVELMMGDDGSYSAEITISEANEAANGAHDVSVTATDMAGNMSEAATVSVTLNNELSFTSTLPAGVSLFSVPLDVEGLDTVGDLAAMLENESLLITYDGTDWNSRSDDVAITGSLGILISMTAEESITFTGYAWEDTTISLAAGSNLVGLPVNDASVTNISDIAGLFGAGVVINVIASSGGEFQLIGVAGDPGDGPVAGDAAYLVNANDVGSATLTGDGWENGEAAGAAPIALSGYTVDSQTPVLDVLGNVVDEITGLTKEGFRVKVKNLSTKAALSNITSAEVSDGYNMTFVDLNDSHAARVGDVLEITADSPDPLVGIKPVRHIVTVDDVKNSRITLEDLIAYEIPAETELLRNYPNPFNPETWIPYHLSEDADVKLTIYDVNGALVRDIDVGHQTAAKYDTRSKAIYWDGRNQFGEQVASGIYFYSLEAGDFSATRKMVILK